TRAARRFRPVSGEPAMTPGRGVQPMTGNQASAAQPGLPAAPAATAGPAGLAGRPQPNDLTKGTPGEHPLQRPLASQCTGRDTLERPYPEGHAMTQPATASSGTTPGPAGPAGVEHRWLILGVIALAQLMIVLDATIMNIALPTAQRDLGFSI